MRRIPELLTKDEIAKILETTPALHHRAMFMLAYGSGLRLSEIVNLKIADIDSVQMRIFISKGKGDRDRYALLPKTTLETLREYWLSCKPKPKDWLFVSPRTGEHVTVRLLQDAFKKAVRRAGITKKATVHTMRHPYVKPALKNIFVYLANCSNNDRWRFTVRLSLYFIFQKQTQTPPRQKTIG